MGNTSGKGSRSHDYAPSRPANPLSFDPSATTTTASSSRRTRQGSPSTSSASRSLNRASRADLSLLGLVNHRAERDVHVPEQQQQRRETKAEREARKLEKEREQRAKDRERSMKEEGVDGGYMVTLGTYTGTEDFSKPVVRQLMIERRLAPFWRGLNDYSDTWTEHQLVAVARGLPLPAADEIPAESRPTTASARPPSSSAVGEWATNFNIDHLTVPIGGRSQSQSSDMSGLSSTQPAFKLSSSPPMGSPGSTSLFKGRAKALAALKTSSAGTGSQTDLVRQEASLPAETTVNGQRTEVLLYKDAAECPICFLYYPPYLNRTRCCDQAICSECFVQIKRPEPHPPEHHGDDGRPAAAAAAADEDGMLVCEAAACPFCVQADFGVTYEPPPFRSGLVFGNGAGGAGVGGGLGATSAMSSLSAKAASVITTDRVRPDWAKKLAEARGEAQRRAAAATALHNAAYVLGQAGGADARGLLGGRRRMGQVGRTAGVDDLEELMMMEAIRLSLASEEERRRREEKEESKRLKRECKDARLEQKKADKARKYAEGKGKAKATSTVDEDEAEGEGEADESKDSDTAQGEGEAEGERLVHSTAPHQAAEYALVI